MSIRCIDPLCLFDALIRYVYSMHGSAMSIRCIDPLCLFDAWIRYVYSVLSELMDLQPSGSQGGTYAGNAVACAAANATIDVMIEEVGRILDPSSTP